MRELVKLGANGGCCVIARKRCTTCLRTCYSFSKWGAWICPHCGTNLAKVPLEQVDSSIAMVLPISVSEPEALNMN